MSSIKSFFLFPFFFLFCFSSYSQSLRKNFKKLSNAEKCWVYTHIFKAKKAYKVTKKVEFVIDSISKKGEFGKRANGNQLDAFKHAYWMWMVAKNIGHRSAKSLGKAHEKGNYQFYKKHLKEDDVLPDKASSEMDLHNNSIGLKLYKKYKHLKPSQKQIIEIVKKAVKEGKMKMISKDAQGNFLDKNGTVISIQDYKGLWINPRCLVQTK